ncbi:MAG: hypothetical protein ABJG41_01305 [Cyclobacteriaceae bacterium]
MNASRYDYLLPLFCDTSNARLHYPFLRGDHVYATNGHCIIKVHHEALGLEYSTPEDAPNPDDIFSTSYSQNKEVGQCSADFLIKNFSYLQHTFQCQEVHCPNCSGSGETHCHHCDNSNPCKKCDGDGLVPDPGAFPVIELVGESINFFERLYAPRLINKVMQVALVLGVENIKIKNGPKSNSATLFCIHDVEVLVVPLTKSESEDF